MTGETRTTQETMDAFMEQVVKGDRIDQGGKLFVF